LNSRIPRAGRQEPAPLSVDAPSPSPSNGLWASDVIAETLRALDIPYAALNPGASFRGLHDSVVNHLGNENPKMILCLHEEHAVAIAHGWAKVRETPMAAIVHSNVGLMHATMAVFNAWCDRVPLLLIGATGPVDAEKRRPWIDWIHTATDQAALVRHYTKWDNQPASIEAAVEALLRANLIARTAPYGPTYVCLDAGLQETPLKNRAAAPAIHRFQPAEPIALSASALAPIANLVAGALKPVILCGRGGRSSAAWDRRIELAERLSAAVLTDLKTAATFPNEHPLHAATAGIYINDRSAALLREADLILSLDWVDLGGTIKTAFGSQPCEAKIIHASLDQYLHNGWSMDHQILPPVDHYVMADPDTMVASLLEALVPHGAIIGSGPWFSPAAKVKLSIKRSDDNIRVPDISNALREATAGQDICLVRLPSAWTGDLWSVDHPLEFLGYDGGGGLASGPGLYVGAALALRGSDRIAVAILGDGDFLMGNTALWTAAHCGLAGLVLVANNRSYFNDELHQERVAQQRGRNAGNKWIGQRISEPDIDIAGLARAQGCDGFGPVLEKSDVLPTLKAALALVRSGKTVVVDIRVQTTAPVAVTGGNERG
jgi:thiamine pyrophosphate-dependent acetolactate synthase large subunit-like protein